MEDYEPSDIFDYNEWETLVFTDKGVEVQDERIAENTEEISYDKDDWLTFHDNETYELFKDLKESLQYFQNLTYHDLCEFVLEQNFSTKPKENPSSDLLSRLEYEFLSTWLYIKYYHTWFEINFYDYCEFVKRVSV